MHIIIFSTIDAEFRSGICSQKKYNFINNDRKESEIAPVPNEIFIEPAIKFKYSHLRIIIIILKFVDSQRRKLKRQQRLFTDVRIQWTAQFMFQTLHFLLLLSDSSTIGVPY